MRVYLWGNSNAGPTLQQRYRRMVETMAEAGASVFSNFHPPATDDDRAPWLERIDAIVIEGSDPAPEAGHLVALALAYRKPVLYLSERGKTVDRHLQRLQENKASSAFLRLEHYTLDSLSVRLKEFLRLVERGEGIDAPTIKFTLRLTPAIERYLAYKVKGSKKTKADFLRDLLERLIEEDQSYRQAKSSS